MNDLNTALAERNRLRRELVKAERDYTVQAEADALAAALVTVRAAGYRVSHSRTAAAIAEPTSVGAHSGQAKPSPTTIPRAAYVGGPERQHWANYAALVRACRDDGKYEWYPSGVRAVDVSHSPNWVVRSSADALFPATLIHIPTGHETTGFPDYASLGRYIRGRNRIKEEYGTQGWLSRYQPDTHPHD